VERPELIPEPVELPGERVRRHVVLAAPHRAGVGIAEHRRPLVRQLDEARVVLADRYGDRVPPLPRVEERLRIAALGEDLGDLLDVETIACPERAVCPASRGAGFAGRTILAAAVRPLHSREDL